MKPKVFFTKIAGLVLVGVLVFTACDDLFDSDTDNSGNQPTGNNNTGYGWYGNGSSNSFTISNYTQLTEFARIVKGNTGFDGPAQSDFKGKTVTLTADIDMSGKSWNGVGNSYIPLDPFNGTFDGNNKTISNLNTGNQGFFGLIGEDGIVKNMFFVDLSVSGSDGGGGLTRTNRGRIQNISIINGNVNGIPGGVVCFNYGIVENCNFSGTISGGGGGIALSNSTSGVIRNCYVTGSVTSSSGATGGIVGSNNGIMQNCYATCNIIGGTFIGYAIGGITGSNSGTVKNCYATGNITGTRDIGGVVGDNSNGTIQNCYATGNVTGESYVGGITGGGGTVQNSVALNLSITATTNNSILRGYTGRVGGSGNFLNNYGLNGMTVPSFITVTSNTNGIHGADVEASDYNSQIWWTTSSNWNSVSLWDFTTVWEWDNTRNLPKLR